MDAKVVEESIDQMIAEEEAREHRLRLEHEAERQRRAAADAALQTNRDRHARIMRGMDMAVKILLPLDGLAFLLAIIFA